MANNPIRRAQLIAPFGVGAMVVVQGGIGLLTAGLDHWYRREDGSGIIDDEEFVIEEWRLQRLLGVDHFRLPPDHREPWRYDGSRPNVGLTVPFHRFPQWHFCPRCDRLDKRPLSERGRPKCSECESYIFQVPFVSMCEAGHLQDFPWREWVHRQRVVTCDGVIRLKSTGSASLAGQKVVCDKCGKERNLRSITSANTDGSTYLSKSLTDDNTDFTCLGDLTWLGEGQNEECTAHLRGSLRSASNVYFSQIRSSLYLPRSSNSVPEELITLLANPPVSTQIRTAMDALAGILDEGILEHAVRRVTTNDKFHPRFEIFDEDKILQAAQLVFTDAANEADHASNEIMTDEEFRREEYIVLREAIEEDLLSIKEPSINEYGDEITQYFSKIMLIDKLRETRAMTGFTRVYATNSQTLAERKAKLRRDTKPWNNWLPAYIVYGEGIFFEFDEKRLSRWEENPKIKNRIEVLSKRYSELQQSRRLQDQEITPRFVLLHTFAHILMNRLTFECGYSSAALRERLYVSHSQDNPMAGVLIYTADGDAEGTMGGLVRMGKQGYIEPVIRRALRDASWCSSDPVCTEVGGTGGQGPDSCNLAACHNCALVPETACEHFNRFLDRVTLVGDINDSSIGYFLI